MIRKIDTLLNKCQESAPIDSALCRILNTVAEPSIDVGAHLRAVRTLYGMSQRELAKRAGVTNGMISLIEQNRVSPSVGSLKKVLDGVPLSMAEFFTLGVTSAAQVLYAADELVEI